MKLKRVYLEISNICNLSCSFCAPNNRLKRSLTYAEFNKIALEIKSISDYIYFHIQGEPLLHPLLNDFLNCCKQIDLKVQLVTNGTLLSSHASDLLSNQALRKISFSLHSINEHKMTEDAYLNPIIDFASKADIQGYPNVELRFWNCKLDSLDDRSLLLLNKIIHHFDCSLSIKELIEQKNVTLSKHVFLHFDEPFIWPDLNQLEQTSVGTCHGARDMIGILSNGEVIPCCLDYEGNLSFGNIFNTSLSEMLASPRFKALQEDFKQYRINEPLCKKCSYRLRFNRK